jgi:hypothetical protein
VLTSLRSALGWEKTRRGEVSSPGGVCPDSDGRRGSPHSPYRDLTLTEDKHGALWRSSGREASLFPRGTTVAKRPRVLLEGLEEHFACCAGEAQRGGCEPLPRSGNASYSGFHISVR